MHLTINKQGNTANCAKDYSDMEPSFSLAAPYNKPIINKGDTMEFEVCISGYGHIENKVKIYASLPIGLVDDGMDYGHIYHLGSNDRGQLIKVDIPVNTPKAFYIWLTTTFLKQIQIPNSDCYTDLIFSEMYHHVSEEISAPISISIITSKNAPAGDNKIDLILTYSDGKKWYQDKQEIKFHINSIWEKYHIYHVIATGVVVSIIGIFCDILI